MTIRIEVVGSPQPGGSKRAFLLRRGNGDICMRPNGSPLVNTVDANPRAKDWKSLVAWTAKMVYEGPLLAGPLHVTMEFVLPRPKGHWGSGRNAGVLKPSAPTYHTSKPDVLKLARSTEDALTGVIWRDDAANAVLTLQKTYGRQAGCVITVRELEGGDADGTR